MGNFSVLKVVTITHPHPQVNYFTLLSYSECSLSEGARLTALKSTEQVSQRHQQSQFSCTSVFLNHSGLTVRQPELYPESVYSLQFLKILCFFLPYPEVSSYKAFFFLNSLEYCLSLGSLEWNDFHL